MTSQAKSGCKNCGRLGHTQSMCPTKPRKPLPRVSVKKKVKVPTKKKPKAKTRSYYVKELDRVFSIYIRQSKSVNGMATCVTCGTVKPWREMQNGHFFTRGRYGTRWNEDNCFPQDAACNVFLKGNYIKYTTFMIDQYGREFLDELERSSLAKVKIPTSVIKEKIEEYSKKVLTI